MALDPWGCRYAPRGPQAALAEGALNTTLLNYDLVRSALPGIHLRAALVLYVSQLGRPLRPVR